MGRVVDEPGVMPQGAKRLDPSLPVRPGEILIDVDRLNLDAASFRQIRESCGGDAKRMVEVIAQIVRERGKMQNPVTGSGGMLIGRVREVGAGHPAQGRLRPGDRIATLVSLTLTPLALDEIVGLDLSADRADVKGHAILFASGAFALLPQDLPDALSLAALDVCGAPAWLERLVRPGMTVLVIGAGKSGALALAQARKNLEGQGMLIALDVSQSALRSLSELGLCHQALQVDATRPTDVLAKVSQVTGGKLCDLVVNCASVPRTEMASILAVKGGGTVLFFSMATQFTAAALGAEGVGKDATLLIGNGYAEGHAELTLGLVREVPGLRALFERRFLG